MSAYVKNDKPCDKKFVPIGKLVVGQLIQDASGSNTEGGVIIPEIATWRNPVYAVVACGPECKQIKEGDRVLVSPELQPRVVRYAGDELHLFHEEQVSGIVIQFKEQPPSAEEEELYQKWKLTKRTAEPSRS